MLKFVITLGVFLSQLVLADATKECAEALAKAGFPPLSIVIEEENHKTASGLSTLAARAQRGEIFLAMEGALFNENQQLQVVAPSGKGLLEIKISSQGPVFGIEEPLAYFADIFVTTWLGGKVAQEEYEPSSNEFFQTAQGVSEWATVAALFYRLPMAVKLKIFREPPASCRATMKKLQPLAALKGLNGIQTEMKKDRLIPVNIHEYAELLKFTVLTLLSELERDVPSMAPLLVSTKGLLNSGDEELLDSIDPSSVDLKIIRDLFMARNTLILATRNAHVLKPIHLSVGPLHGNTLARIFEREGRALPGFSVRLLGAAPSREALGLATLMDQINIPQLP